jgi:hypothetical protein
VLVAAGLSYMKNKVQKKIDNGHQNVVFVVNDVNENVEVVSVSAVVAGEGGKSKKNR